MVSGDWIIMAPGRAKRPHDLLPKRKCWPETPKSKCPFEDLRKSGNWPPIEAHPSVHGWKAAVIPNKFPALRHESECAVVLPHGPYSEMAGIGEHELVITRDHGKSFKDLAPETAAEVFRVFAGRCRSLAADSCLKYVSIFLNYGPSAGASVSHPHYQILALPIVPPEVDHSLQGSARYYRVKGECVHCAMIRFERKEKQRIVARNAGAVAFAPFASRNPFEVRVFPAAHLPRFERSAARHLKAVSDLLRSVLKNMEKNLRNPDLNFFIHTSPLGEGIHDRHYHWHVEILPKISIPGGFELGTGVDINVVDPSAAAAILRA